jgi:hypothetical protein
LGSGGIVPTFFISSLDGGEWSASCPGRFILRNRAPDNPLNRRLGGPQSRSEHDGEEKNSQPLPGLESPIIHPAEPSRLHCNNKFFTKTEYNEHNNNNNNNNNNLYSRWLRGNKSNSTRT